MMTGVLRGPIDARIALVDAFQAIDKNIMKEISEALLLIHFSVRSVQ